MVTPCVVGEGTVTRTTELISGIAASKTKQSRANQPQGTNEAFKNPKLVGNQAVAALKLNPSAARFELLAPSARAIVRLLVAQGGSAQLGHASIAKALSISEKTVELYVPRLAAEGWVRVQRARRRPAIVTLSEAARRALFGEQNVTRTDHHLLVPPKGFHGDARALDIARKVVLVRSSGTSRDLAEVYLEHADPDELARIHALRDDDGSIPIEFHSVTGDAKLDDGLLTHFDAQARQQRTRSAARRIFGLGD